MPKSTPLLSCAVAAVIFCLATGNAHAASDGLDTPSNVGDMPVSIEGTQVMDINPFGLQPAPGVAGIGVGLTSAPTRALDVNGYVRIRQINNEGGVIQLDGANSVTMYLENLNGTFRLVNSPWNAQLFSIDQTGNVVTANSVTVGSSNLTVSNGNIQSAGEVIGNLTAPNSFGQLRMIGGNYGAMWRNDGANLYLLFTNAGNTMGAWNAMRPLTIGLADGNIHLGGTMQVASGNGVACKASNAGTIQFVNGSFQGCNGSYWTTFATGIPPNKSATIAGYCSAYTDANGNVFFTNILKNKNTAVTIQGRADIYGGFDTANNTYNLEVCTADAMGLSVASFNQSGGGGANQALTGSVPWQ